MRRHPLDWVYLILKNCVGEDGKQLTYLMGVVSLTSTNLKRLLAELVKVGVLECMIVTESSTKSFWPALTKPSDGTYPWENLTGKHSNGLPGAKSDDGKNHRYKTTKKGCRFIELYDEMAKMMEVTK